MQSSKAENIETAIYSTSFNKYIQNISNSVFTFNDVKISNYNVAPILLIIGNKGGGIITNARYYLVMLGNNDVLSVSHIGGNTAYSDLTVSWTPNTCFTVTCPTLNANSNGRAMIIFL